MSPNPIVIPLVAGTLFSLSSCLDRESADAVAAIDAEILNVQRATDRVNAEIGKAEATRNRALDRAKQFELEQLKHFNAQEDRRAEVEFLKAKITRLEKEFSDYRAACVIGALKFE